MNHLAGQTSPYLLQHADNPVDWYPWGPEALERARRENKPIFLSIGYSACHWCHVMARESFENAEIAAFLNEHFVSVKVDREERPDLDQVFQAAVHLLGRSGGWPLTAFLTPEGKPFFAGTYFPPEPRHGMISFPELLKRIVELFETRAADLRRDADRLASAVRDALERPGASPVGPAREPDGFFLADAAREVAFSMDPVNGGFGGAPKFPAFPTLLFLLRHWRESEVDAVARAGDVNVRVPPPPPANLRDLLEATLDAIGDGGIFDQLGGGFHRYSVDAQWRVPHFEKMLYDNALALQVYSEAHEAFGKPRYLLVVRQTFEWMEREMRAGPRGAWCSSMDADSGGVEGAYYSWTRDQLARVLDAEELKLASLAYGLKERGPLDGTNVLRRAATEEQLAKVTGRDVADVAESLAEIRRKLLDSRGRRVRPGRDDKVLTAWNAMLAQGLFAAARATGDHEFLGAARSTVKFLLDHALDTETGELVVALKGTERSELVGNLDDYAHVVAASLEEFELSGAASTWEKIESLVEVVDHQFWSDDLGAYHYASNKKTDLLARPVVSADAPLPSPNAVMAANLLRMAQFSGDERRAERAREVLSSLARRAASNPVAHGAFLLAAQSAHLGDPELVVVPPAGSVPPSRTDLANLVFSKRRSLLAGAHVPRLLFHVAGFGEVPAKPLLEGREPSDVETYYFCVRRNCLPPVHDEDELRRQIRRYYAGSP
ncbi:MAG: thioredoxin domain-containing protein [Promethearchaeota archaeon]